MRVSIVLIISMSLVALIPLGCESEGGPSMNIGPGDSESDSDTSTSVDTTGGSDSNTDLIDTVNMPVTCADGVLDEKEACDDQNHNNGDGCTGDCLAVEEGWSCNPPGLPCHRMAVCGDGQALLPEMCDDGNSVDSDGCSATCKIEVGSKCLHENGGLSVCSPTTCGDSNPEGAETCDDGNVQPFDGCSIICQKEPICIGGAACTSECGDGMVIGAEECDDGNKITGDGCSDMCLVEPGFTCTENIVVSETMTVPIVLRDFLASDEDFEYAADDTDDIAYGMVNATRGLVQPLISATGKPVFAQAAATDANPTALKANGLIHSSTSFDKWYTNSANGTATVVSELVLYDDDGNGSYVNRYGPNGELFSRLGHEYEGDPMFFPLDNAGITAPGEYAVAKIPPHYFGLAPGISLADLVYNDPRCQLGTTATACNPCWPIECVTGAVWPQDCMTPMTGYACYATSPKHNFHFTTEVTYWFEYNAANPPSLSFIGDDDLWVFVNGKLALDLGGIHVALQGDLVIDATMATALGLEDGGVYEIKVFHAERQTYASTYKLTLSGFSTARSQCTATCGDGIVSLGEQCDDILNDGGYGECGPGCKLDAYCGDGILQTPLENCDDGNFINDATCPSSCRIIDIG